MASISFQQLGLKEDILKAVSEQGYKIPSAVQVDAIPAILGGRDIHAGAQTGTGKTAAFALPILHKLSSVPSDAVGPRALILAPTRELATQIFDNIKDYGRYLDLRVAVVFGGASMKSQINKLSKGQDILIATPGRLLDHLGQKTVDLAKVDILVLDEADRMLDMGFSNDIRQIDRFLPKHRQNLLFSATYPRSVKELADSMLVRPLQVQVTRSNAAAETVEQVVHPCAKSRKMELVAHIINHGDLNQVLIFTKTKHSANELVNYLKADGISALALHGNKTQGARRRALEDFKKIKVRVLVATDIASRGIDIDTLPYVINYELPGVSEDYVHRVGRSGRAGSRGKAMTLICADEKKHWRDIEQFLKRQIPVVEIGDFKRGDTPTLKKHKAAGASTSRVLDGDKRGVRARRGAGGVRRDSGSSGGASPSPSVSARGRSKSKAKKNQKKHRRR